MLKIFSTILLIFFVNTLLFSQTQFQKDIAQINYYYKQINKYRFSQTDSANFYIEKTRKSLIKTNYPKGWEKYYSAKGNVFFDSRQLDSAKANFIKSLKFAIIAGDSLYKYKILGNIGMIYNKTGKLDSAKIYLYQSLRFAKKSNNDNLFGKICMELSQLYIKKGNYNKSIKYAISSDSLLESQEDTLRRTYSLNSLAINYTKIGQYDKSIEYYHLGIKLSKLSNPKLLSYYYSNIGDLYSRYVLHEDSAIYYLTKAIELSKEFNMANLHTSAEVNLSGLYYHIKQYHNCINILRKYWDNPNPNVQSAALINGGMAMVYTKNDTARQLLNKGIEVSLDNELWENLMNGYSGISYLDSLQGDYYNAYLNYLKYDEIKDTLYNRELQQTISAIKLKNQLEKDRIVNSSYEKRIELQNEIIERTETLNIVLIASTILVGLLLILLLYLRRKRSALHQKLKAKNTELQFNKRIIEGKNYELVKLNEMKITLFSVVSHDLKSYISSSNQLAHLFFDQFDDLNKEKQKTILKSLVNSSDSVYNLTENLLNWSKLQNDNVNISMTQLNLSSIVTQAIESVASMYNSKNIILENNITNDTTVFCNNNILLGILRNLLSNAIKFTHRGGQISVIGSVQKDVYQICVKDNGVGMSQEIVDNLFDAHSDYHTLGSENENGSGFGLKLIKTMINKIDSKIWVTSNEGVGSEFCFTLKIDDK